MVPDTVSISDKMDKKVIENLINSVKVIRRNQKTIETKVDIIEAKFEDLQSSITENWNQVGHLESDHLKVQDLIKKIDIKLIEFETSITETVEKIKVLEGDIERTVDNTFEKSTKHHCKECKETFDDKTRLRMHIGEMHPKVYKCNLCDQIFDKRCKLENHLKDHNTIKEFKCDECGYECFLKWRLHQHIKGHKEGYRKFCHYFNNDKSCPFVSIGCKFKHENSGKCTFGKDCKNLLCQYNHDDSQYAEERSKLKENQAIKEASGESDYENIVLECDNKNRALEEAIKRIDTLEENKVFLEGKLKTYSTTLRKMIKDKELTK